MKFRTLSTVSAFSLLLAAGAYAADQPGHRSPMPGTNHEAISAIKDTTAGAVGAVTAGMTTSTTGFVNAAAVSDMYEVEAGKIAQQRGQSRGVKDFGHQMVQDHGATTDKLKAYLRLGKLDITPVSNLDSRRQGMIDDLRGAKAEDFDHRYLAQQEAAHKEALILLRGYAANGETPILKSFASEVIPKVEDHLAMVQKLQNGSSMASNK